MANYCCAVRTNYFRVKDDKKFREFMEKVATAEDELKIWENGNSNNRLFGFGGYSGILGIPVSYDSNDDDDFDYNYEAFAEGLSKLVADDDAIIILESGNEKLRYIVGDATIITSKGVSYKNISDVALAEAAALLGNPGFKTQLTY